MRKQHVAVLAGTAAFSFLFYSEAAGLNYLLFSIVVILLLIYCRPAVLKSSRWVTAACCVLFTGTFVLIHGSSLAVFANFVSLVTLGACSINPRSSLIFSFLMGIFSLFSSLAWMIMDLAVKPAAGTEKRNRNPLRLLTYVVPAVLLIIFYFVFRSANPLFERYTTDISLDFISWPWLGFTVIGFIISFSIFEQRDIKELSAWEAGLPLQAARNQGSARWNERRAATALLVAVNIMMLFITALDLRFLYLDGGLPEGITHKEFVHNGVGMLMISIVLSIGILFYFFRGEMAYAKPFDAARVLAIAWTLQNLLMVVSTAVRNQMYISEALLTYKRIGVYFWLGIAAAGLVLTLVMLLRKRSAWYVVRNCTAVAMLTLCAATAVDWDMYITRYNTGHCRFVAGLDKRYLISLSEGNLPALYTIRDSAAFAVDSLYHYEADLSYTNRGKLDEKLYDYLSGRDEVTWKSFTRRAANTDEAILRLATSGAIHALDLSGANTVDLRLIARFRHLETLDLSSSNISSFIYLKKFPRLQRLDVPGAHEALLDSLPAMDALRHLDVSGNKIKNLMLLRRFPLLKSLNLSNCGLYDLDRLPGLLQLDSLVADNNALSRVEGLERSSSLRHLSLQSGTGDLHDLPRFPALRSLDISRSRSLARLKWDSLPRNLEALAMSGLTITARHIDSILFVRDTCRFPALKELDLSGNIIPLLMHPLTSFTKLESVNLSDNKLRDCAAVKGLNNLTKLNLSGNTLKDISDLGDCRLLEGLSLYRNHSIRNFQVLARLTRLKRLDLGNTGLEDLGHIPAGLEELDISGCVVDDLRPLLKMKNLQTLYISNLTREQADIIARISWLRNLYVADTNPALSGMLADVLRQTRVTAANE